MPSPPPSTILHESLTSGTEFCLHSHSEFLFVLHVVVVYLFDFRLLIYASFFEEKKNERDFTFAKEEEGGSWRLDEPRVCAMKPEASLENLVLSPFCHFLGF